MVLRMLNLNNKREIAIIILKDVIFSATHTEYVPIHYNYSIVFPLNVDITHVLSLVNYIVVTDAACL